MSDSLEAESIEIILEAVAGARNPVMLYSIGKDSSAMLHLARKSFHPALPPFPLLHVDTTWKFRDMYAHRERAAAQSGRRGEQWIMVDDERFVLAPDERPQVRRVRFRTLGCYPLSAAIESDATTVEEIVAETLAARRSEREGRLIDSDQPGSMERKKREGYF